jgi:hypothetical protein
VRGGRRDATGSWPSADFDPGERARDRFAGAVAEHVPVAQLAGDQQGREAGVDRVMREKVKISRGDVWKAMGRAVFF